MSSRLSVLSIAVLALAAPALAAPLPPGGTLFLAPGEPEPLGGSIVASMTLPFSTVFYTGTLTSTVIAGDVTNPYGGLTFIYTLHNDDTSAHALARLTVNGYAGFQTDASYSSISPGIIPLFIDRQINGDSIGFSFSNALQHTLISPGGNSTVLIVQTNAPAFVRNVASVIDGAVTQVDTFAPAVPTPGATALAGLGLLAATRRRRA